jgi:hypothetical protein
MRHPDTEIDAALGHVRKLWHALMRREISVEEDLVSEYRAALKILDERGHLDKVGLNIKQVQIPNWWAEKRVFITLETIIEAGHGSGTFWGNLERILRGW